MTGRDPGLNLRRTPDGVAFTVHATPRARRERVGGLHGDALRVAVSAPPVEGAANRAIAAALAEALEVPRRAVTLDPGARGRRKAVRIEGDPDALVRTLRRLAREGAGR